MSRDTKTEIDLKKLKAGGFIKERGKDLFTVRLRIPGGRLLVERLKRSRRLPRSTAESSSTFRSGSRSS